MLSPWRALNSLGHLQALMRRRAEQMTQKKTATPAMR
jgi:hypothetical protein